MAAVPPTRRPWTDIVAAKRKARDESLEQYSKSRGPPDKEVSRITAIDNVDELVRLIASGSLSAIQVVDAYITK